MSVGELQSWVEPKMELAAEEVETGEEEGEDAEGRGACFPCWEAPTRTLRHSSRGTYGCKACGTVYHMCSAGACARNQRTSPGMSRRPAAVRLWATFQRLTAVQVPRTLTSALRLRQNMASACNSPPSRAPRCSARCSWVEVRGEGLS
jgi:hypothetical protein